MDLEHKALVVIGTLSLFLAEPLVRISSLFRSEPVYIVFTLLLGMSMSRFLADQNRRSLGLAILWAALATMQRTIGMSLNANTVSLVAWITVKLAFTGGWAGA